MEKFEVRLDVDYLRRVSMTTPIKSIAELIWNALDADAHLVEVDIERNSLGAPELVRVVDNGHGMSRDRARAEFEKLGGSWKGTADKSQKENRILHGKLGQGRFKAFALGDRVEWRSKAEGAESTIVRGALDSLLRFEVGDATDYETSNTGTEVRVLELNDRAGELETDSAFIQLCGDLGPYLRRYPGVKIRFLGREIDPESMIAKATTLSIRDIELSDGQGIDVELEILEWTSAIDQRSLYLCDESGFALERLPGSVPRFGINYTAHAQSDYFAAMARFGAIQLHEMSPDLQLVITRLRGELRDFLRQRHAEFSRDRVKEWVEEEVYPYTDEPKSVTEAAERQVFDIVAVQVADYLPSFEKSAPDAKRFQLTFLKEALKDNPAAVKRILTEVVNLPAERQTELAELLEYTTLSNVIRASKTVADRLAFLRLIERLLFEKRPKAELKERSQLHRMLATEPWIFGEKYALVVDDKSLVDALIEHAKAVGKEMDVSSAPTDLEGKRAIIDLMLTSHPGPDDAEPAGEDDGPDPIIAKKLKLESSHKVEHLVVELKRPNKSIDDGVLAQLKKYAFAVAADDRFDKETTEWTFLAVSNRLSPGVDAETRQEDRDQGLVLNLGNIKVWVKTWAQMLEPAKDRLHFYQRHLELEKIDEAALQHLNARHSEYISPEILDG